MKNSNYKTFVVMLCTSFFIMYGVMFLNVAKLSHVYLSLTRFYMTVLMVAPMALVMLFLMGNMYPNKKLNTLISISSIVVFFAALLALRSQTPVNDVQYMKAMIPHHSSAILTSEHANIKNPEVKKLADGIIESQKKEIAEMKALIDKLDK